MECSNNNIVSFQNLYSEGEYEGLLPFSDGKLLTEDGWSFEVSRLLLGKENKYFKALFINSGKDKNVILVPGVEGEILNQILYYIYTKALPLNNGNIVKLLKASDYLLVDGLKLDIKKYILNNLSLDVCLNIYVTALQIKDVGLQKFTYRYIQTNFQSLVNQGLLNFKEISCALLEVFLNDVNICITGEHVAWFCIKKWVMEEPVNSASCQQCLQVPQLIKCLKMADVNDSLANEIIHCDIICNNPAYKSLIDVQQASPSHRSREVLKAVITNSTNYLNASSSDFHCHRRPRYLYIIIQRIEDSASANFFITYDERLDLWRFLDDGYLPEFVAVIRAKMYFRINDRYLVLDLIEKEWSEAVDNGADSVHDVVVNGNRIYSFSKRLYQRDMYTMTMRCYDTVTSMWFEGKSLQGLKKLRAASYKNEIFVVGFPAGFPRMQANAYDVSLDRWRTLPPSNVFRLYDYSLIEYNGKLYLIGGELSFFDWNRVEVFDPETNEWNFIANLRSVFNVPKAVVFEDQLIIYEDNLKGKRSSKTSSPIVWNEQENAWEELSKESVVKDFKRYLFFKIDNTLELSELLKGTRDPTIFFDKSSFHSDEIL